MGLFGFGKKKEESAPACACQCGCPTAKADVSDVTKETGSAANETPSIKVNRPRLCGQHKKSP